MTMKFLACQAIAAVFVSAAALIGAIWERGDNSAPFGLIMLAATFGAFIRFLLLAEVEADRLQAMMHRAPFDRAAETLANLPRYRPLRGDEITSCD